MKKNKKTDRVVAFNGYEAEQIEIIAMRRHKTPKAYIRSIVKKCILQKGK